MTTLFNLSSIDSPDVPLNILHVDDDDTDAEVFSRGLRRCDFAYQLHRAHDGEEALQKLRGGAGVDEICGPVVVLLDLNMPRMNGFEFLEAIQQDQALRSLVVFVLSTSTRDVDVMKSYEYRIAGYISKDSLTDSFKPLLGLLHAYSRIVNMPH